MGMNNKQNSEPIEVEPIIGFGARLKALRLQNGMTMEQFGKKIKVSAPTIAAYETESRSPRLEVITAISKAYDCSVDYLLGLTDVPKVKQDIYDAHNFFMKQKINWHGTPIDPNDLTAFRALLEQIMDAKTGYAAPKEAAAKEPLPFQPDHNEPLDQEKVDASYLDGIDFDNE